jgi:hypothetical protein
MIKFDDIQHAFSFVSSASYGMHDAVIDTQTGIIYYRSELGGYDEISENNINWGTALSIPHKNDLDLGQELVYRFVNSYLPKEYDRVQGFFRRSGAYQRYKEFLDSLGLLQQWYDFESKEEKHSLELWCQDKGVEFDSSG